MAAVSETERQNILEEYKALRAEILLLIQMRNQFWIYDLTGFGVFIGLAFQSQNPGSNILLLIAPLIHYPLMMYWAYADRQIIKLGLFLKEEIATRLPGMNWEEVVFAERRRVLDEPLFSRFGEHDFNRRWLDNEFAAFLTFAGSTLVALVLWTSTLKSLEDALDIITLALLVFDMGVLYCSFYLTRRASTHLIDHWKKPKSTT